MFRSAILRSFIRQRHKAIDHFRLNPIEVQHKMFRRLVQGGARTLFGAEHSIQPTLSADEFARRVPLYDYDSFKPYIERMLAGQADVASRGVVSMFARSSGTTSDRSKYIPISEASFFDNHLKGMSDVSTIYDGLYPQSRVLDGQVLTLGGSCSRENHYLVGDLSGLIIRRMSICNGWLRLPKQETALLSDFDQKCERICRECLDRNVTSFAGVPSWNLALMSRVLEYSGKSNLLEVWPKLELFVHGGIEMTPYRQAFAAIDGGGLNYMETYNASEGFFAISDDLRRDDMLLMLDYQTYFEFREGNEVVPLEGVRKGVVYAVVITSSNGLWRYEIGDTVEFTSLDPYRIRFAGRTRQYINAFGEEVIVENADRAIVAASQLTGAVVGEYMVAPRFMDVGAKGCHQWLVEFVREPSDMALFAQSLDGELRAINSDYDAKRLSTLSPLEVWSLPQGSFVGWMRHNNKNKVPRLSNDRKVIEGVIEWINKNKNINIK